MTNKIQRWGLSMYGGYYAQVFIGEKYTGIHTDTLRELRQRLAELGLMADKEYRFDN